MEYITVYTTRDESEVGVLKSLFEVKKLDFKITEEEVTEKSPVPARHILVAEKDREEAREILHETGYLKIHTPHEDAHERKSSVGMAKKWIFVFLAALILVIVALVITWFMNAP